MGDYDYLPFITFGGFSTTNSNSRIASLGSQRSDWNAGFDRPFTNVAIAPTVTWLRGSHSLRGGYDLRIARVGHHQRRATAPDATTSRAPTRAPTTRRPQNDLAQSWAQFLLGLPTVGTNTVATSGSTGSQFEISAQGDFRQISHGLFLQDDWRVNRSLTLNLGVRLEIEQALTEAEDRNLGGFDASVDSPIEAAARLRYAANPIPQIPAGEFR